MTTDISVQPTYYLVTRQVFGDGFTTVHEQPGYHISAQQAAAREDGKLRAALVGRTYWYNGGPCIRYHTPHEDPDLSCITTLEWRTP